MGPSGYLNLLFFSGYSRAGVGLGLDQVDAYQSSKKSMSLAKSKKMEGLWDLVPKDSFEMSPLRLNARDSLQT